MPVTIRGEGPFRFVLDTGASSSAVDEDVARKLKLPRTGRRQPISGVTGTEEVPVVELRRWAAGKTDLNPTEAIVIGMKSTHGSPRIQGLLGSDVLSRFGHITVDYSGKALLLPSSRRSP
ncbi:retroviral-like aspartic protease family protein [Streptomyces sp. RS10V-4]|uniref:retropepsin-like aspartic protease n=1 Tax=Streptomyces rhizoryzae TaxID=2932493 RepID=UPI0020036864|nr:retropepsin-like aspartic protease [Streptomyces rhizoryzae]MCK7624409.1 retroviral-like aspartic protease family protein [Streptomyces rhizoryzae]